MQTCRPPNPSRLGCTSRNWPAWPIGKPVLLVADNTATAAQVEALIPARSEHRLLVTSRDILAWLSRPA